MPSEAAAVVMPAAPTRADTAAFARVAVYREAAPVLDAWAELERVAPCSIYQTRAWLLPWLATLGHKAGVAPLFVLAHGLDDRPVALLALGVVARGPLRVGVWLGGRDANFHMPLIRSGAAWTKADVARLLRLAARACGRTGPHLFHLTNQPYAWDGRSNPLALLPHQLSPSAAYGTALPAQAESLFGTKLSKDTRKKLRKKEAKLAGLGPLRHIVAADAATQHAILEVFLAQKVARLKTQGIPSDFDRPEMRTFIAGASAPEGHGIELHALLAGERIIATYGGASHGGQWSGMFNSFDPDEEISKSSPGDLLLMRIIAKACADGLTRFDLGIGEARYKAALCDEQVPLFDVWVPITFGGRLAARLLALRQRAKRAIKSNPRLFALARKMRATLP